MTIFCIGCSQQELKQFVYNSISTDKKCINQMHCRSDQEPVSFDEFNQARENTHQIQTNSEKSSRLK
jgi:hypothetical protein